MINICSEVFAKTKDGREVVRYEMKNANGMAVRLLSYGCIVQSILVPDRNGSLRDVALGYDTLEGYEKGSCFFGAFVGRYANRIRGAEFTLNGRTYQLKKNEGSNHLHGKLCTEVFDGRIEGDSVIFTKQSAPGDEGYPGNLNVEVRYTLTEDNALVIAYRAETDEDTVINLTNHSYFNLNGQDGKDVLSQWLRLDADAFTAMDAESLPTGEILSVEGTPMDFREAKRIGRDIEAAYEQLRLGSGYDHNFILRGEAGELREFAEAFSEESGITLTCGTTQPGVQFYSGNFLDAEPGKDGVRYPVRGGFCLETQHYPDAPNHPEFPTTVLKKGEVYREDTVYRFGIR